MELKTLLLWIIIACIVEASSLKVSFYGASYIAMPLQEAKMSTNIRLKFRTQQENALLFLAAGRTDYCLLKLESGRINFKFKIDQNFVELWSPKTLKFNDLLWHEIAIQRYETNLTMQIEEHFVRNTLPTNTTELNIHFGTFLGGVGDFSESYLTEIHNFRGCISDVFYNNINILKRAKERTAHVSSVAISWTCSTEFEADAAESVSFVEEGAFFMLAQSPILEGESWNFDFRTIETDGTIFYNGGSDFVLLEIVNEKLRLHVTKGSNAVELLPERNISDGKWHHAIIRYNPAVVEIFIDDFLHTGAFANGSKPFMELDSQYFFGGVTENSRRRAAYRGLRAGDTSLKGCIRNIEFNNRAVGFPDAKVTNGVFAGCVWKYPCIEKMPCLLSSICRQYSVDEFICYCDQAYCLKADYAENYKVFGETDIDTEIELLSISPMQLLEGESVFISPVFIEVLLDYAKLGIPESSMLFHIVQPPKHGQIAMMPLQENPNATHPKVYSFVDLSTDKMKYIHNGNEQFSDHMTIDFQITGGTKELPDFLLGKHRFLLHANITPVNDPPALKIPLNKILRITQGIPKVLSSDLLSAHDPDSSTNSLVYTLLTTPNSEGQYGRLEVNGKSVMAFSQAEINQGSVTYLVNTPTSEDISYEIILQVSDGIETSPAVYLPVSVHPLQLRIINNTGLIMVHKSSALITPWNLSIISNSDEDSIDVRYEIVQPPHYGAIQKLRSIDSSWIKVDSFTSSQLMLGQIRYYHNTDFPIQDDFKFTASYGPVKTQKFDFRITFTRLRIGISKQISLSINGSSETIISNENLYHQTSPLPTFARNIIYTVLRPPKYGAIYVDGHPKFAKEMDSFTQMDIDKNLIRYRTHRSSYSSFIDDLQFIVSVSECDDVYGQLTMVFNPEERLSKRLSYQARENVKVQEGDRALLTRKNFEILFNTFDNLTFVVAENPKHGSLCNYEAQSSQIVTIEVFPLEKLYLGDVYYCHDDSESIKDSFQLLVLSDKEVDLQYVCDVDVEISLVNDNGPYRAMEEIFHVVRGESRTVMQSDLNYLDVDINTNLSDIHYTHVSCINGEFYKSGRYSDRFSQDDINNRRIVFQHSGPDIGSATFIVTDGSHEVPGTLEVHASDPFVEIPPKNASIVQEGKFLVLKTADLSIRTNLNKKLDEIEYRIVESPSYGVLKIMRRKFNSTGGLLRTTNLTSVKNFTQLDVERERLAYWNTEPASMDKIKYQVSLKNITAQGEILIRIYPAAYWELLQVKKNQTLFVEESTSVLISKDILEIIHPNISPGDITYLVTQSPQHGYLEIQSITSDDEYNCKVFDQSTINSEKMFYIQAGVNQSSDHFVFDVTNGITWLRDLTLKIVIIPEHLYVETSPVVVVEGKTVILYPENMQPYSEYYKGKILEYKILQQPSFGYIISGKSKVNRFTQKQLDSGVVQYVHNGSENSSDSFTLMAIARNKESIPFDMRIIVTPVNDEVPVIVTNTGLQLWNGGQSVIKNTDIMAQDYDSPSDNLTYYVSHMYGGYLAQKDNLNEKLDQFTQHQIDSEEIYFIHDLDSKRNELSFIVTDGLFNTTEQTLVITANPVTLEAVNNENLHVFPMTRKQILPEQLTYKCSDETRDVRYIITEPPQLGRILYEYTETGMTKEVLEFDQDDIVNGRILYEHTTAMQELKTNDTFVFDVTTDKASRLFDQKFNIEISVSSGGLLRFLPVSKIQLDEGASAVIKLDFSKILEYLKTRAGMIAPELYIESFKPAHGIIELQNSNRDTSKLTPDDFTSQRVYYTHDHSDTLEDKILMSVFLLPGNIFLCNLTVPVSVNPINDQPYHLITRSPHMTVIEGENRTITKHELLTEDIDTGPEQLVYDVISGPTLGLLMKLSSDGSPQDLLVYANQFTQADINSGRIVYVHFGSPQSTTFYFKVSDGVHKQVHEIFNIRVLPISISPDVEQEPIRIQQGANIAFMETKHVAINTNAQHHRLMYNVTNSPLSGIILFNHQPTLRFSQMQLENNQVSYMQTDMTKSNDTFQINAYIVDTNYGTSIDVRVIVEPFIKINAISITAGDKIRLTSAFVFDNPMLVKLNKYNPKITISRLPRRGRIRKIIRNSGESENLNDRDITSFTYKELKSGVVYYVSNDLNKDDDVSVRDSFEYILSIKTVQPAQGYVPIEIHTFNEKLLDGYNGSDGVRKEVAEILPLNYIVLICVLVGLAILILIILLIIKVRHSRLNKCDIDKDLPPPLPRPPDFMTLNNNRMYAPSSENESFPVTAASTPLPGLSNIPHCKVIPIGGMDTADMQNSDAEEDEDMTDEMAEAQRMTSGTGRGGDPYNPYCLENDDWSSSCDMANELGYSTVSQSQQQSTNPLLRRNQYWV